MVRWRAWSKRRRMVKGVRQWLISFQCLLANPRQSKKSSTLCYSRSTTINSKQRSLLQREAFARVPTGTEPVDMMYQSWHKSLLCQDKPRSSQQIQAGFQDLHAPALQSAENNEASYKSTRQATFFTPTHCPMARWQLLAPLARASDCALAGLLLGSFSIRTARLPFFRKVVEIHLPVHSGNKINMRALGPLHKGAARANAFTLARGRPVDLGAVFARENTVHFHSARSKE